MVFFILCGLFSFGCLGVSYISYRVFLSEETGFAAIRGYLLWSIVTCLLVPFLPVSWLSFGSRISREFYPPAGSLDVFTGEGSSTTLPAGEINYGAVITCLYLSGILFLLIRGFRQLWLVFQHYRGSSRVVRNGTALFVHTGSQNAFTFLRWIFIHPALLQSEHADIMIEHETIHRRQWHTVDLLIANLGCLLLWFNPFAWKIRDAIALNHEYLADQQVLRQGNISRENYQILLVNQVAEETLIPYSSAFNAASLKNRLTMMSSVNHRGKATRKIVLLTPSLLIFFIIPMGFLSEFKVTGKTVDMLIQQSNELVITGYAAGSKPAPSTATTNSHTEGTDNTTVVYTVNGIDADKIRSKGLLNGEVRSVEVTRRTGLSSSPSNGSTTVVVNINTH